LAALYKTWFNGIIKLNERKVPKTQKQKAKRHSGVEIHSYQSAGQAVQASSGLAQVLNPKFITGLKSHQKSVKKCKKTKKYGKKTREASKKEKGKSKNCGIRLRREGGNGYSLTLSL